MKKALNSSKILRLLAVALISALPTFAITAFGATFDNPLESNNILSLIGDLINALIKVGAVLLVLFFIYAGFQFVTANGEQAKITKAKDALLYCVVGGIILLGANALMLLITTTMRKIAPGAFN